ncbi:hypothetical protein [Enterococcus hirae]|uniref:Uncharacterized protein n=1 Tax=Siphoviridae sp. ctamP19 TaxID=2827896 RepID=A0A8S5TND4_9CAUD|nr:MAG TPA: hypothetical protein [Siphoviridae sp. ctamP19]
MNVKNQIEKEAIRRLKELQKTPSKKSMRVVNDLIHKLFIVDRSINSEIQVLLEDFLAKELANQKSFECKEISELANTCLMIQN